MDIKELTLTELFLLKSYTKERSQKLFEDYKSVEADKKFRKQIYDSYCIFHEVGAIVDDEVEKRLQPIIEDAVKTANFDDDGFDINENLYHSDKS